MSAAAFAERVTAPTGATRLLAGVRSDGAPVPLEAHLRRYGGLPGVHGSRGDTLTDLVAAAGLQGRGGAGFPTASKIAAVLGAGRRPIVVANGVEGEPASGKDKVLLAYVPQLVLDGAVLAARAVGARQAIVAVGARVQHAVVHAVAERGARRLDAGVSLRVVTVAERFIAGEETALVQFLNGGPALPTFTPPRPFERGVGGAPTLVQNVETLAQLALIARFGPEWFRGMGTADEPGTALVTVSGAVREPGVYEVPLGRPFGELIAAAGGATDELQALLVGGYFGTWVSAADSRNTRLCDADLVRLGASLGARAVVALPASSCGVTETARIARYLSDQSAGQCGPCVHGLAAVADGLEHLARRERSRDGELLRRRLDQIAGRGACRHPDGVVGLVASAMRVFAGEFDRHAHGRCQSPLKRRRAR